MKHEPLFVTDGIWIKDAAGRRRIFRGCNLGGDSKVPFPNGATGNTSSLDEPARVSFIGRPFPEHEADDHFARLASLGCTFVRWIITWEAVEHAAPDCYDEEYLAYLRRLLKKAEQYGIVVYIDPHQDVWSRWTGGDGAPAWTLEAVGFDLAKLETTGAARTMQGALKNGVPYKEMTWMENYRRYACATLFTLFFAGNTFAPFFKIDGEPVQEYLQDHFIAAMRHTARRLKDCRAIIGFGILNEPDPGFIGAADVTAVGLPMMAAGGAWPVFNMFDSIKAASGFAAGDTGTPGVSVFKDGYSCPWLTAGVWDSAGGEAVLKNRAYFSAFPDGTPVDFRKDFLKPFQKKFIAAMREKHEQFLFFTEGMPPEMCGWNADTDEEAGKVVESFHWYDGKTLFTKKWHGRGIGNRNVRKFSEEIGNSVRKITGSKLPPFVGEFGVPFDMDGKKSYATGDYSAQSEALACYYEVFDELLLSVALWNYSAGNTHAAGDGWNGEDLSVFCCDTGRVRGEKGFCRPYAMATAGMPVRMRFFTEENSAKPVFEYEWDAEPCAADDENRVTELYIPDIQFPGGWKVASFTGVGVVTACPEKQRLFVKTVTAGRCRIKVIAE